MKKLRVSFAYQREDAGEDWNVQVSGVHQHCIQNRHIVNWLCLHEPGAAGDLFLQAGDLGLYPGGVRVESCADGETGSPVYGAAEAVYPRIQVLQQFYQADRVEVEYRCGPGLFTDAGRIAGYGQDGTDAEQACPHQVRLQTRAGCGRDR